MILGISITIGGIFLYKSYAYYENEKEYNVIKGIIPDFSYDVKFAVTIDNQASESIPTTPKDANKTNYYKVTATCDNGIKAEWDYNAWNLKVEDIQKGTKCKLAFNSTLTEEDYKEYIQAGVAYRRNTYRGKDITSKLEDGTLFSEIKSGKFDDIFVGDYIVDKKTNKKDINNQPIRYLVADIDNYMYSGVSKHHVTIIPAAPLINAQMNSTNTTVGGYAGSEMVGYVVDENGKATDTKKSGGGTLDNIYNQYITPVFENNNIIKYSTVISSVISADAISRFGTPSGVSDGSKWINGRQLDLMSEVNVYGTIIWTGSGYDIGMDKHQYAIFQLKPELINTDGNGHGYDYWLSGVASSVRFADCTSGHAIAHNADEQLGVRPRFLIG